MTFSSQLGDHSVPAAMAKPEQGFFTGTAARIWSDFGSTRKIMSVPLLLVQTESSVTASLSGPPLTPLASMLYWASGIRKDMGACTPGTPGFCAGPEPVGCCPRETQPTASSPAIRYRQLGHDVMDDLPGSVGQPEITPAVGVGELQVVYAEQIEDSGVEIVHVHGLLHGLIAEVVGGAVCDAALDAAPGHPQRKTVVIVI